jgi:hypothetical protein
LVFAKPNAPGDPAMVQHVIGHIPDCRVVELAGENSFLFLDDIDPVIGEVEEFLTGAKRAGSTDRVLATVLFTDIVASTEQLAASGDDAWGHPR